jgi:D-proline reductase (dithiol) PrdB
MPFDYLPVLAQASAPKPPRVLVPPSPMAWCPLRKPVTASRVALLTSAALRLKHQPPFSSSEDDLSYRLIPSDPAAGELVLDHRSRIGAIPRRDPQMVFPRSALAALTANGDVGTISPVHISIMGGTRRHDEVISQLAPAIARELTRNAVDLAVLVPY